MVNISLSVTGNGNYKTGIDTISYETTTFGPSSSFDKVTYKIDFKSSFPLVSYATPFYINLFDKNNQNLYSYYTKIEDHIVRELEAYFSKDHRDFPLVIGFKSDGTKKFQYYSYKYLIDNYYYWRYGFVPSGHFSNEGLEVRLTDEHNRVHRIKFSTDKKRKYQYCEEKYNNAEYGKFKKYWFYVGNNNRYEDHILTKEKLFDQERNNSIDGSFLKKFNDRFFDCFTVYYTKNTNIALLVEIDNGSEKTLYKRKDKYGTYWIEETPFDTSNKIQLNKKLVEIKNDCENKISYLLDKRDSYGNIHVDSNKYGSKELVEFTHILQGNRIKSSLLFYNSLLIELQTKDVISGDEKLTKIQEVKYSKIKVYFTYKHPVNIEISIPIFLELNEFDGSNHFLQRVDDKGIHWKLINETVDSLDNHKIVSIFQEIDYGSQESIMVQINKTGLYEMRIAKNYETGGVGYPTYPFRNIEVSQKTLVSSSYQYFEHDLSRSRDVLDSNIIGLRLYIKTIEINKFNSLGKNQKFSFTPKTDSPKKVYVYFYPRDTVPLMITYDNRYYRSTKANYFIRWTEIGGLQGSNPTQSDSHGQIKRELIKNELERIDKEFNEIDLSKTDSYGLSNPKYGQPPSEFYVQRITVKKETTSGTYGKVSHRTVNNSSIGRVMYETQELKDDLVKSLSDVLLEGQTTVYKAVVGYYYKSDSTYKTPIFIGFSPDSRKDPTVFYQRVSISDSSKWKKVQGRDVESFRYENKLVNLINKTRYNISKSVVIKIDNHNLNGYDLNLVDNSPGTHSLQPVDNSKIEISEDSSCLTGSNYSCYKHSIPRSNGLFNLNEVGGLRFNIYDYELPIHRSDGGQEKLHVYYEPEKNDVKVYFYKYSGSDGEHVDKVPLLVSYSDKYYRPSSRDEYFKRWFIDSALTSDTTQLTSKLDEINKELNRIDIFETKHGSKYGLNPPADKQIENFKKDRVRVELEDNPQLYRKVTHKTTNKGPIGDIHFAGKKIESVTASSSGVSYNKVEVYYLDSDSEFSNPLLICLGLQTPDSCKKWFSKSGVGPTEWNKDSGQYDSDESIKDSLNTIKSSLSNSLYIDLASQETYDAYVSKGNEERNNILTGKVNVYKDYGSGSYTAKDYRPFEHKLDEYYTKNKQDIISNLGLGEGSEPTLQLKIKIDNHYIELAQEDGRNLSQPLTFGNSDLQNLLVYFYEGKGYVGYEDTVPLMLTYKTQFFGPQSKEKYFDTWKDLGISTSGKSFTKNIKEKLDEINSKLNEIDLSQTSPYGLGVKPSSVDGEWNRIIVTSSGPVLDKYIKLTHKTKNGYRIGDIKQVREFQFDNGHLTKITGSTINELIGYACIKNSDGPKLVLICESASGGSYLHGYYNLSNGEGKQGKYEFAKLDSSFNLDDLEGEDRVDSEVDSTLREIFKNLCQKTQDQKTSTSETSRSPPGGQGNSGVNQGKQQPTVASPPPPSAAETTSTGTDTQSNHVSPVTPPKEQPPSGHGDGGPGSQGGGGAAGAGPHGDRGDTSGGKPTDLQNSANGVGGGPNPKPSAEPSQDSTNGDVGKKIMDQLKKPEVSGGIGGGGVGALALGGGGYGIYAKCIASTATSVARAKL